MLFLLGGVPPLTAEPLRVREFNVPDGFAGETLRLAAIQGEMEILFTDSTVQDVTTQAITGLFSADQALRQMLEGTVLSVIMIRENTAIAVKRQDDSTADQTTKNTQPTISDKTEMTPENKYWLKTLTSALILTIGGAQGKVSAQEDDQLFELSPFSVESVEDSYLATSTLAGTRIKTDLSDIAASISIFTNQVLEDLSATDAGSLLVYAANIEVAGTFGNYSSAVEASGTLNANSSRINPQGAQRVRGLVEAELTRNYFKTSIPFDSYNTSTVTINRGPNSVLFGLGSPGGVIENTPNAPVVGQDFTELRFRVSNFGSTRATVDVNRSFFNNRLALRVDLLNEKERFRQEEAFEDERRGYLAWNWVLNEGTEDGFWGSTTFRGNFEAGERKGTPPDIIPPGVGYAYWFNPIDPAEFIGKFGGVNSVADLPSRYLSPEDGGIWGPKVTMNGLDNVDAMIAAVADTPRNVTGFINIHTVFPEPDAQTPSSYLGAQAFMPRNRFANPMGRYDFKTTTSNITGLPGFRDPTLQDRNTFDFVNHLYSGRTTRVETDFDVSEFVLEQQLLSGNAGFEIAYNQQSFDRFSKTPFSGGGSRVMRIDLNEFIPIPAVWPNDPGPVPYDLLPNPNWGRPMLQSGNNSSDDAFEQETFRATAFYTHDFRDSIGEKWGKWLGRHTLTGFFQDYTSDTRNMDYRLDSASDEVDALGADILNGRWGEGRPQGQSRVYVGPSALGANNASEVKFSAPLAVPDEIPNEPFESFYWDHGARAVKRATFYRHRFATQGSQLSQSDISSDAFLLQSNWLADHVVTIFAVRNDEITNYEAESVRGADGTLDFDKFILPGNPSLEEKGETITKSLVVKYPETWFGNLPFGMDLRVHYFESETFQPLGGISRDFWGNTLPNPNGVSEEYGFSFDLFERRLSMRVNWYETSSNAARTNLAGGVNNFNRWVGSQGDWYTFLSDWESSGGLLSEINGAVEAGFTSYDQLFDALFNIVPQTQRNLWDISLDRTAGRTGFDSTPIEGLTTTFDFVSEGMEIEIAGAITDNWNLMFNIAQQETIRSNTGPGVLELAQTIQDNIISAGLDTVQDLRSVGDNSTYLSRWNSNVMFPIRSELAKDGTKAAEQREWRWNMISTYRFKEGFLEGVTFGGAGRWQDKSAIGYPIVLDQNGDRVQDIENPYFGDTEFNADVWVSYQQPIFDNKIDWVVQLNVKNLVGGGSDDFIPIAINPVGKVDSIRLPVERQIFLTNTFKF